MSSGVSPLLLQRYELKYLIPLSMVDDISKYVEGHMEMDYYSQISPDKFYTINSLYFDTPNFEFLRRKREGIDPTWSLRVRSYGAEPKPPFFAEVKWKECDFSNKMRTKLGTDWAEALQDGRLPDNIDPKSKRFLSKFLYLMHSHCAGPKVLTQYRRKAYLSTIEDYARVTFDRDLRFQFEDGYNVIPDETKMCHYDLEEIYPHPDDNVILELKCEKRIPLWIIQLIKTFDLTRRGFSKYGNVILQTMSPEPAPHDWQESAAAFRTGGFR